eukprot:scaffold656_cov403-Pavlova_lutheri.AAC.58
MGFTRLMSKNKSFSLEMLYSIVSPITGSFNVLKLCSYNSFNMEETRAVMKISSEGTDGWFLEGRLDLHSLKRMEPLVVDVRATHEKMGDRQGHYFPITCTNKPNSDARKESTFVCDILLMGQCTSTREYK